MDSKNINKLKANQISKEEFINITNLGLSPLQNYKEDFMNSNQGYNNSIDITPSIKESIDSEI
jgi:hypothetical protein